MNLAIILVLFIGVDFDLERNILADDYSIINFTWNDSQTMEYYSFSRDYYNSVSEYVELHSEFDLLSKEEIVNLYITEEVKDYSDLATFTNLEKLSLGHLDLGDINFKLPSKLEEIGISTCTLNGKLDFKESNNLREIDIRDSQGDLANAVIDIRGMYWLRYFNLDFDTNNASGFKSDNILIDDYTKILYQEFEREDTNSKSIHYRYYGNYYYTIEEFIEQHYIEYGYYPDDINELHITGANIQDYSGLSKLKNLKKIYIEDVNLKSLNLSSLEKLELIHIFNSTLEGTLNFSNHTKLNEINVSLTGNLSNAIVDVRNLESLEHFTYEHFNSTGFDLKSCILMDDYDFLSNYTYESEEKGNVEQYSLHMGIYNTIEEYLQENYFDYTEAKKEEITSLYIYDSKIKDYSGLSNLINLTSISINNSELESIDFERVTNIKEIEVNNCKLNGTLDFTGNNKLKNININLISNLSNSIIDIRGMEWLNNFEYKYSNNEATGFNLENCILMDDYTILDYSNYESEENNITNSYSFNRVFYYTIDEFLESYYPGIAKKEITDLEIWNNVIIKDYSGLATLTNLTSLDFYNTDLKGIDFEIVPNLENVYVYNCTLDGTLDFTGNSNLKYIDINLTEDLTNAIVDIRGLTNLEHFSYEYYTDQATGFNLNTCILKDSTLELNHNSDAESMYERYYYNNYIEEPDDPEYPEYPDYIISNLNTYQIDDNTRVIYGFVLNEEKILTVGDILSRNYFVEGITAKIFKNGTEVTNSQEIVGTGTIIKLYEGEELVEEYTIVIYGDATGDGKINTADALAIIKNKNQKVLFENKILEEAGKVTEKSYYDNKAPTAVDALAIIKYVNGKYDIDQRYYW